MICICCELNGCDCCIGGSGCNEDGDDDPFRVSFDEVREPYSLASSVRLISLRLRCGGQTRLVLNPTEPKEMTSLSGFGLGGSGFTLLLGALDDDGRGSDGVDWDFFPGIVLPPLLIISYVVCPLFLLLSFFLFFFFFLFSPSFFLFAFYYFTILKYEFLFHPKI